ncbi:MAG: acetate/propionate family kinase [Phycisphaerae bacterium]
MQILTLNCGSSTLKFHLLELSHEKNAVTIERHLARGSVDRIGDPSATVELTRGEGTRICKTVHSPDHTTAIRHALDSLEDLPLPDLVRAGAVGHRVVHGGESFVEPTLLSEDAIGSIDALSELAPVHNKPAVAAMRAMREALGPDVPMVAVFDTSFHRSMPHRAARYPLPSDLTERHHIRRYGFHGLAHRYMTERYAALTGSEIDKTKLITLQLGNGCSAAAVAAGRSVDTSMGFTPAEGLMMGTRCGDIDPTLVGFLSRREHVDAIEAERWLSTRSGLLGVSGRSRDMRELLDAARQGDKNAILAIDMFCYRVRKYIGSYSAVLNGADAVIFGGGIGENAPEVRRRICCEMGWCGLILDNDRNTQAVGIEGRISADHAGLHAYVVAVDEAVVIASDTYRCVKGMRHPGT